MNARRIGNHDLPLPKQETMEAAGYDLRSTINEKIWPGERRIIPTGFAIAIPTGMTGMICPRSGLAAKNGLTVLNAPGIIDSDFRGELQVILINHGDDPVEISHGDRIAQLVVVPCLQVHMREVEQLDATERGEGGLGSTGLA